MLEAKKLYKNIIDKVRNNIFVNVLPLCEGGDF